MNKKTLFFTIVVTSTLAIVGVLVRTNLVRMHRVLGSLTQTNPTELLPTIDNKTDSLQSSLPRTNDSNDTITTNSIVDATNKERIKAGLPPLTLNPKLVASATLKTNDMIAKQYFEHVSPTGIAVSDLGDEVGYSYVILGENLALGDFVDTDDLLQAWMNSPGHRANILNPNYQEIGAYAAKGEYQGKVVWFAVQHFGTSRTVCPTISMDLKTAVDTINNDLKRRQVQIANEKTALETTDHPEGDTYKTMVDDFNALVVQYNTDLVVSQEKIKQYNAQVSAFNSCLTHYQTK